MTGITQFQVVTPGNLGSQFTFNSTTGKWVVAGTGVSSDAGNILTAGTDHAPLLTQAVIRSNQTTYTLAMSADNKKIQLMNQAGAVISVIDPTVFEAQLDGVAISNGVFTFNDASGNAVGTLNTGLFLQTVSIANSNAVSISGTGVAGSPVTASLVVDTITGNLLKVSTNGALVSSSDILALLNANITHTLSSAVNTMTSIVNGVTATAPIVNSNQFGVVPASGVVLSSVNGVQATAGAIELVDSAGIHIAYAFQ